MLLRRALRGRSLGRRWAPAASCVQPQQSAQRPWCKELEPPDAYTPFVAAACQTVRQIAHAAPLVVAPAAAFASTPNGTEAINTAFSRERGEGAGHPRRRDGRAGRRRAPISIIHSKAAASRRTQQKDRPPPAGNAIGA
jgi:Mg-chelatase subunit ChlI